MEAFRHGLWFMFPFFFLGHFFWFIVLALLIGTLVRRLGYRRWHMPYYSNFGVPPAQSSAMEILRQRYARGEIDAVTFDQMRERLEASSTPYQRY